MKPGFKVGLKVDMPAVVKPSMKPYLEGLVSHRLYATWAMVYHMETASRMLLAPYLEPSEEAVGAGVLVKHLRPARLGSPLHVVGTLVRVRGSRVYSRIEVFTRHRKVGEGSTMQVVMSRARFARLLKEAR
ncbi:MAG: thioesterase [Elusimicrobia bacterium]|nr:thioesterase [Elusimicrobiota bacterium]